MHLNACFLVLVRSCVPKIMGQSPATSTPSTKDIPAFRQGHFAPVPIDFGQAGGNAGKISVRTGGLWSQQNEYPVLVIFTLETPWEKEPKFSLHTKAMWIFSQESGLQKKKTHIQTHRPTWREHVERISVTACLDSRLSFRSDRLFSWCFN